MGWGLLPQSGHLLRPLDPTDHCPLFQVPSLATHMFLGGEQVSQPELGDAAVPLLPIPTWEMGKEQGGSEDTQATSVQTTCGEVTQVPPGQCWSHQSQGHPKRALPSARVRVCPLAGRVTVMTPTCPLPVPGTSHSELPG